MFHVMEKGRVPVKVWSPLHEVESAALDQLTNLSNLPCVYRHVAAMPDVHVGKGATVGSVIATHGAIIPAAVGVDIGCGMDAVKLPLFASDLPDSLNALRVQMEWSIPVGRNQHKSPLKMSEVWPRWKDFTALDKSVQHLFNKAQCQIGSLGGGNHFIELCLDESQQVWLMLHSGSRNIGKELAEVYIDKARGLMRQYMISLPDPDLAYLVEGTTEFAEYWSALQWAQDYAKRNREVMMNFALCAVMMALVKPLEPLLTISCHHNYAEREHHFNHNVIVTRKGAVRAREGDHGIIPGSMGTQSYIVRGLGNPDSFHSCSHGAGRRFSRTEAKRRLTLADVVEQTAGVECRKDAGIIDELPGAYKDIDEVMARQSDLVTIEATLKQVMCIKG
jgi:tRNA-splicing ligase RtcB